jgi:hypothetical protein
MSLTATGVIELAERKPGAAARDESTVDVRVPKLDEPVKPKVARSAPVADPWKVIVVPVHVMSPPDVTVLPVSRFSVVFADRVVVPVTSARATTGKAIANTAKA